MQFIIHSLKMVLTFIKSQRNKDQLVDSQGYVYSQTIRKNTWTCAQSKAYKCNVTAVTSGITVNDNITRGPLTRHLCVPKTEYQILFHNRFTFDYLKVDMNNCGHGRLESSLFL